MIFLHFPPPPLSVFLEHPLTFLDSFLFSFGFVPLFLLAFHSSLLFTVVSITLSMGTKLIIPSLWPMNRVPLQQTQLHPQASKNKCKDFGGIALVFQSSSCLPYCCSAKDQIYSIWGGLCTICLDSFSFSFFLSGIKSQHKTTFSNEHFPLPEDFHGCSQWDF